MIGSPHHSATPVEWNGKLYAGRNACARAANVDPSTIDYHLNTHGNLARLGLTKARPITLPPLPWEAKQ